ncbi:MAG: DegT/DnrJ/EryC1/StrS family aminotransferase [Bacteroidales bacterium]|nr:DegT/DnrJ/EryC1/StrS family aminotransferase [Bacteroidales bacterium]
MIPVTKPYLPNKHLYKQYIDQIWDRQWFTNHGPLVTELEKKLAEFSGRKYAFFVANGTIGLQISIKALNLKEEIITTPFSYVATTSSIVWENCKPVFADIDPLTWNISPKEIEKKITKKTTAIIATHIYGNPCDVEAIEKIAKQNNLYIIYDAAHAFGSTYKGKSLYAYGDIAVASFHATKLFHTAEGGAIFCDNEAIAHRVSYMRNFGHNGQEAFWGLGINGKNSELHAAIGLAIWPDIEKILLKRKEIYKTYFNFLYPLIKNNLIQMPVVIDGGNSNYSYLPILLRTEEELLKLRELMHMNQIYPRRYFYPSLSKLPYVNETCPISEDYSKRVLCLPSYFTLSVEDIKRIVDLIKKSYNL